MVRSRTSSRQDDAVVDEATERLLVASRALVGVAARSLASVESEITLRQYRALVVLAATGQQNVGGLAEALDIHPSTATRLCDRLIAKNLIERQTSSESRREVSVGLTPAGRALVTSVMRRRQRELRRIVRLIEPAAIDDLIDALVTFTDAAGELPDDAWKLGWNS